MGPPYSYYCGGISGCFQFTLNFLTELVFHLCYALTEERQWSFLLQRISVWTYSTEPDLSCSTVFRLYFFLIFVFWSCGRLSWLNRQLSSAGIYIISSSLSSSYLFLIINFVLLHSSLFTMLWTNSYPVLISTLIFNQRVLYTNTPWHYITIITRRMYWRRASIQDGQAPGDAIVLKRFFAITSLFIVVDWKIIAFLESVNFSACVYLQIFNFRDGHVTTFRYHSGAYICQMPGHRLSRLAKAHLQSLGFPSVSFIGLW